MLDKEGLFEEPTRLAPALRPTARNYFTQTNDSVSLREILFIPPPICLFIGEEPTALRILPMTIVGSNLRRRNSHSAVADGIAVVTAIVAAAAVIGEDAAVEVVAACFVELMANLRLAAWAGYPWRKDRICC